MEPLVTTAELQEYFQVTRKTISNWRENGMPTITIGRTVRFKMSEVEKWAKKQEADRKE